MTESLKEVTEWVDLPLLLKETTSQSSSLSSSNVKHFLNIAEEFLIKNDIFEGRAIVLGRY